ncbi:glycoside hydrolase [Actinomadura sp. ATCC 31491]|uniref:Glycoside hydrolase n=1 Tax=Actinomadura luzonensis TaxID=2805427 RepID=A0ABT0G3W2_9ACTN|nr:sialidase family protein [Actinomadura luzonensis]MCK2219265.1 glycoside hydrolase [Actinomadura luzonensis]
MRLRHALNLAAAGTLVLAAASLSASLPAPPAGAEAFGYQSLKPWQRRLASGALTEALAAPAAARLAPSGFRASAPGCAARRGDNVKVNVNCANVTDPDLQGRSQAQNETWIAADPYDARRVVAAYNDYRRGDGTCGVSYSRDGGDAWADATVPNQFTRGTAFGGAPREYWQGGGDPSVEWDSRGNVYLTCLAFNRGAAVSPNPDQSSGIYVFRSTGTGGASWNFTGRPVAEHDDTAGAGDFLLDKPLMAVDHYVSSPYRDRVYVTWTTFADDGTAYIYAARSLDYGETFGAPVLVSGDTALCAGGFGIPAPQGRCTVNQFSQPAVGPDGALYVVWANYNTVPTGAGDNHLQMLVARSADGGASFSAPVKAGDFYDLPDCATYQGGADPGRSCVPEKGATANSVFRATNYPYISVNPRNAAQVTVSYGSYVNRNSREATGCVPAGFTGPLGNPLYTGVKGPCNNDIVVSESADGGASFAGGATDVRALPSATDRPAQRTTDQFWHGAAYTPAGRFVVGYFDRQYGDASATGFSDVSLSARTGAGYATQRVTSSSMPPPTQFGGVFYGDYIQITAGAGGVLPLWMDTRQAALFLCPGTGVPGVPPRTCTAPAPQADPANEQEVYTARRAVS